MKYSLFLFLLFTNVYLSAQTATVVNTDYLSLRGTANAASRSLREIRRGQQLQIINRTSACETLHSRRSCWYRVRYNGLEGYAFGAYLRIGNGNLISNRIGVVSVSSFAALKGTANVNGRRLAQVYNGEQVSILLRTTACETLNGRHSCWYKVEYKGLVGYIFGAYLIIR